MNVIQILVCWSTIDGDVPGLVYYHDEHQRVHGGKAKHAAWLEEYQRAKTTTFPESI
jgi:hypothetical protein